MNQQELLRLTMQQTHSQMAGELDVYGRTLNEKSMESDPIDFLTPLIFTLPINLTQMDDLLAVPGFSPEMLAKLKSLVIFLPRATPVNINTAPAEVLAARIDKLTLADAATLVTSRSSASFRDLADLTLRLPGKSVSLAANEASVTTNYFLVNGKVRMNRARLEMQALLERNNASTKLIWIREY